MLYDNFDAFVAALGEHLRTETRLSPSGYYTSMTLNELIFPEYYLRMVLHSRVPSGSSLNRHVTYGPDCEPVVALVGARDGPVYENVAACRKRLRQDGYTERALALVDKLQGFGGDWTHRERLSTRVFLGYRQFRMTDHAKRAMREAGFVECTYSGGGYVNTPDPTSTTWTLWRFKETSNVLKVWHYEGFEEVQISTEASPRYYDRAYLQKQRRFMDAWELVRRSVFSGEYLEEVPGEL